MTPCYIRLEFRKSLTRLLKLETARAVSDMVNFESTVR